MAFNKQEIPKVPKVKIEVDQYSNDNETSIANQNKLETLQQINVKTEIGQVLSLKKEISVKQYLEACLGTNNYIVLEMLLEYFISQD